MATLSSKQRRALKAVDEPALGTTVQAGNGGQAVLPITGPAQVALVVWCQSAGVVGCSMQRSTRSADAAGATRLGAGLHAHEKDGGPRQAAGRRSAGARDRFSGAAGRRFARARRNGGRAGSPGGISRESRYGKVQAATANRGSD